MAPSLPNREPVDPGRSFEAMGRPRYHARAAMSRNGVILLFEGLAETVVDAQVLVHARDMRRRGIADLDVWAVACSAQAMARSLERLDAARERAEGPVRVLRGVAPTLPGSARANARRLLPWLREPGELELVHARTDHAAEVASHLRGVRSFELVWDCRGDVEAEVRRRHPGASPWRAALRAWQVHGARRRVRAAHAACDRAIFVTRSLRERLVGHALDERSEIIPGGADAELFFFSPELRERARAELGWPGSAPVLVYSGGLARYQCFGESVALFRRLRGELPELRLLVVTPQPEAARPALAGLPEESFALRSARLEQVNAWLNAADAALMLRRPDPLNAVAFPTKFAEYGMAGLPVLMTDAVPEVLAVAREVGNLCLVTGGTATLPSAVDRAAIASAVRARLSREASSERYRRVYGSAS
jgi:glycosyltransferase involved in cell wall biosynthesis